MSYDSYVLGYDHLGSWLQLKLINYESLYSNLSSIGDTWAWHSRGHASQVSRTVKLQKKKWSKIEGEATRNDWQPHRTYHIPKSSVSQRRLRSEVPEIVKGPWFPGDVGWIFQWIYTKWYCTPTVMFVGLQAPLTICLSIGLSIDLSI